MAVVVYHPPTSSTPATVEVKAEDVAALLLWLEQEAPPNLLGAYLPEADLSLFPCGCQGGCPLCRGTGFRIRRGPGPLAPHISRPGEEPLGSPPGSHTP